MNIFRKVRNHMIASGVLFTDKQMADAISALHASNEELWGNFEKLEDKVIKQGFENEEIRKGVKADRRLNRDFEREYRELEHEYHDLVRYCLRLEERIKNNEKLLVSLTNNTKK